MNVFRRALRPALRRYAEGADLSRLLRLPTWVDGVLSHDAVAYPLHSLLGHALHRANAPAAAVALEWIKAAAHARSATALDRVAAALRETSRRMGQAHLEHVLNAAIIRPISSHGRDVMMRDRQVDVMMRAGLRVSGRCTLHPVPGASASETAAPESA